MEMEDSIKWKTSHRQWPIPNTPWVMHQSWNDLLFIHYPISIEKLKTIVPEHIQLDTFEGMGWISIVPFKMNNVGIRGVPFSVQFPELNIRTYVIIDNKPGVYFFSLDASNLPVVFLTKTFLNLPYIHSSMNIQSSLTTNTEFICQRKSKKENEEKVLFSCRYRATSAPFTTKNGTLDYWLTERYCFYTTNKKGQLRICEILHQAWPIQQAEVEIINNSLPIMQYIDDKNYTPLVHYSSGVDVRIWPLKRIKP